MLIMFINLTSFIPQFKYNYNHLSVILHAIVIPIPLYSTHLLIQYTFRGKYILVSIVLFASLNPLFLVPKARRLREAKRALGTRMCNIQYNKLSVQRAANLDLVVTVNNHKLQLKPFFYCYVVITSTLS